MFRSGGKYYFVGMVSGQLTGPFVLWCAGDLVLSPACSESCRQGLIKVDIERVYWSVASRRGIDIEPSRNKQWRYASEDHQPIGIDGDNMKRCEKGRKSGALSAGEGSQVGNASGEEAEAFV